MSCVFIWSCKPEFFHASKHLIAFKVFSICPGLSLPWKSLALLFPISLSLSTASCPTAACEVTDEREIVRTERERGGLDREADRVIKGRRTKAENSKRHKCGGKGEKKRTTEIQTKEENQKKKRLEKDKNRKVKTKRGRRCEKRRSQEPEQINWEEMMKRKDTRDEEGETWCDF